MQLGHGEMWRDVTVHESNSHTDTHTCFSWLIKHTHTPTHTCNLQAEPEPISCEGNTQVYVIEYVYTQ